eukprot:6191583-Pleurochrysis_carterae.AAC.2
MPASVHLPCKASALAAARGVPSEERSCLILGINSSLIPSEEEAAALAARKTCSSSLATEDRHSATGATITHTGTLVARDATFRRYAPVNM